MSQAATREPRAAAPVRGRSRADRWWPVVLGALALVCCAGTALVSWPGRMTTDTIHQLEQALGRERLSDWHPPIMSEVWRALLAVTGSPASMMVLQAVVLWAALLVIAVCVWFLTANRAASLAVLAVGLLPQVLIFEGVVWKDVQMACALLAVTAVSVAAIVLRPRRRAVRWTLFAVGLGFLEYATLVRKNAIFATVPLFLMLVLSLWRSPRRRVWAVAVAALVVGYLVPSAAITTFLHPVRTSQISQIYLDDLVHVVPPTQLATAPVSPYLQRRLYSTAVTCHQRGALFDAYWRCWGPKPHDGLAALPHKDEIASLWRHEMSHRVTGYLGYRLEVFADLLFKTRYLDVGWIQPHNPLGLHVANKRLIAVLVTYVEGMRSSLPFLYMGWFWLVVGAVLAFRPGVGPLARPVRFLGISAVAYLVGYLPIVPATSFRYVHWPAVAGTLGLVLLWVTRDRSRARDPAR